LFSHKESIDELIRVLSIKFGLDSGEIFRIVSDIHTIGKKTTIVTKDQPIREDITDNLFINPAIDGDAQLILKGEEHSLCAIQPTWNNSELRHLLQTRLNAS